MITKVMPPKKGWVVSGSAELCGLDWFYPASTDVHLYVTASTADDARARAETRVCANYGIHPTWDYFEWSHDPFVTEARPIK